MRRCKDDTYYEDKNLVRKSWFRFLSSLAGNNPRGTWTGNGRDNILMSYSSVTGSTINRQEKIMPVWAVYCDLLTTAATTENLVPHAAVGLFLYYISSSGPTFLKLIIILLTMDQKIGYDK